MHETGANLPISIASYDPATGMYRSPLLCETGLTVVPAWTLDDRDEALRVVCQIDQSGQTAILNNRTLPEYMRRIDLFPGFQDLCFMAFFSGDYVCTIGLVVSMLLAAQLAFQLVYRRGLPKSGAARYVSIGLQLLLLALALMCAVYDGTQLRYPADSFAAPPRYDYPVWPGYVVAALGLAVVVVQAVSVVRQMAEQAPPPQREKRRKIRHGDVWGPQLSMVLIEAVVNIVRFLVMLTGVLVVLKQFNLFGEQHMRRLSLFFFGRLVSALVGSIEARQNTYFVVTLLLFVFILPSQMILRSQKFAARFTLRDDAKVDWRQFWVKQLLTLFCDIEALLAIFMYSYINEPAGRTASISNAPEVSLTVLVETFVFGVIYNLLRYPMVRNYYMIVVKTLLKVLMDVLIALYALAGFFVYSVFALVGLCTVKGFACGVQGCSFGAEILKMLATFAFYLFLAPVDAATIFVYPIILMVKGFEAPAFAVLELLGVVASDAQLSENTRLEIPREKTKGDNARRVPEVVEKVVAYACVWLLFSLLLQRNMPRDMFLPFVMAVCAACAVVVPAGLFYRRRMQEAVADLNGSNQSLLTQVSWVNHMGQNIKNLSLTNAQLTSDMNCIEVSVSAECPWLEKFRADQLRVAANFLPVIGPATGIVGNNFRLCFRGSFSGPANLASNIAQFLLCASAVAFALFVNRTREERSAFYVVFALYFVWTLLEYFDDVQDFTLADYRLKWKQNIDKCAGCRRESVATQPLIDGADASAKPVSYSEEPPVQTVSVESPAPE